LSRFLKVQSVGADRMSVGRLFHTTGPATSYFIYDDIKDVFVQNTLQLLCVSYVGRTSFCLLLGRPMLVEKELSFTNEMTLCLFERLMYLYHCGYRQFSRFCTDAGVLEISIWD